MGKVQKHRGLHCCLLVVTGWPSAKIIAARINFLVVVVMLRTSIIIFCYAANQNFGGLPGPRPKLCLRVNRKLLSDVDLHTRPFSCSSISCRRYRTIPFADTLIKGIPPPDHRSRRSLSTEQFINFAVWNSSRLICGSSGIMASRMRWAFCSRAELIVVISFSKVSCVTGQR